MKKKHQAHTGIRIPSHKIKWMPPLPQESSDEISLPLSKGNKHPLNLYYTNLNFFVGDKTAVPESEPIIEITDWKEVDEGEN